MLNTHELRVSIYLVGILAYLYRLVRANRKDRVLLCEALGVGIFLALFLSSSFFKPPDWLIFLCGFVAVIFAVLACYFGLVNWAERRVKKVKAR